MEDRKLRPRRPRSRRKVCRFCVEKATSIDYKDIMIRASRRRRRLERNISLSLVV